MHSSFHSARSFCYEKREEKVEENTVIFIIKISRHIEISIIYWYLVSDMIATIGGYVAMLGPALTMISPFIMYYWLLSLSDVVRHKYKLRYRQDLIDTLNKHEAKISDWKKPSAAVAALITLE